MEPDNTIAAPAGGSTAETGETAEEADLETTVAEPIKFLPLSQLAVPYQYPQDKSRHGTAQ